MDSIHGTCIVKDSTDVERRGFWLKGSQQGAFALTGPRHGLEDKVIAQQSKATNLPLAYLVKRVQK